MVKKLLGYTVLATLCWAASAQADEARLAAIDVAHRFYEALGTAPESNDGSDKAAIIGALLASSARIELTDLDLVQTKDEFIGSLTELDDALSGTRITHRIEAPDGAMLDVLVCYEFESNAVLNREKLTFENGMISVVTQTPIADKCDAL